MRNFILFLGLLAFSSTVNSQTLKQYLKAADQSFLEKDYYSAMKYYDIAHEIEEDDMNVLYKYAESARLFGAYTFADTAYSKVLLRPEGASFPMGTYWWATVKKQLGQYDEAAILFEKFLNANLGTYDSFMESAKEELEACNWAIEVMNEPDESILINPFGASVNTPHSEFAAVKVGNTTYYSSYSFTKAEKEEYPPRQYVKVLKSIDDGETTELVDFNDENRHTAHVAFNNNKTRVYYTLCDYASVTEIQCELFYRDINKNGEFSPAFKLPSHINLSGCTNTEPNIGYDEATDKEWLFFVSDRVKGKGKLDIWASEIKNGKSFSQPVSLPINTAGNDITPYFHSRTQTLYFSSDGRKGLGGFDVYKVLKEGEEWKKIEHLPVPLNSSYNDSHYVLNEGGASGFLSSNRLGSIYLEPEYEACCNDIYSFSVDVVDLNALTFSRKDDEALAGVKIELFEVTPDGEIKISTQQNKDGNDFDFELEKNKKYVLLASKDGFVPLREEIDLTNPELTKNRSMERKLFLLPTTVDLDVLAFNKKSNRPLPGVSVRLVEDGQEIAFQENEDANAFDFVLERGKKYELIGTRVAFVADTAVIDLTDPNNSVLALEEKLMLRPKEISEFPPLVLYFDNDTPDPKSRKSTTDKTYEETYVAYLQRQQVFIDEYTKILNADDSTFAAERIRAFFERELTNGYEGLMVFSENVKDALNDGYKIELEVQGYTSPRAEEDYNERLSKRRANSLYNHFERYSGGALKRYLDSGQLSIVVVGYGEKFAPQFISDKLDDERESIYSLFASVERKVAIIGIKIDQAN
jgi:tetratricopeptide (TPR) repeat protein